MKNKSILLLAFIFCFAIGYAQSSQLDKKLDKAKELVQKEKYTEAETYLEKVLVENPEFGDAWTLLAKIRYKFYKDAKASDGIFDNMVITTKDKDGKEIKDDSLANSLRSLLTGVKPSKKAFSKYIYTMRKALLTSRDASYCSILLRNYYVDIEIDTALTKKALKYYNEAESEFGKKNYDKAAKLYKRAIDEQPDFYKANLYLGDSYYFMGNYIEAIKYFKECSQKFPNELEPRKYLVDAYAKERLYSKSLEEAIASMAVYPDLNMLEKLEDAAYLNDKKIDIRWTPRPVFPNKIKDSTKSSLNEYVEENKTETKDPWIYYQKAFATIRPFCNDKGIINTKNDLTASQYMEVYCWEEMLKNSNDKSLEEARRMQKDGFLDCYVLVTCYHFDFYDQYKDFASKNQKKIIEYFNKYLINK